MADPRLPPLTAIRAFEAAARHGSFTKAAEELGMTQAAVSYQIKQLEERVGTPLFLRRPRQVELTEAGLRLAPSVTQAFDILAAAFTTMRRASGEHLAISTVPTFASNWLAQRLGAFQMAHPRLSVRLDTSSHFIDFAREEMDAAIRVGKGQWPGLVSHLVEPVRFTPMLTPDLAASIGGISEPADLLRLPIIGPGDPWWPQWLSKAGAPTDDLAERPQTQMGSQISEGRAALAGLGVAMLTPFYFKAELESGRLIQPFDLVCENGHAFWLVYPEARRNVPKIAAFRTWLLNEIARD